MYFHTHYKHGHLLWSRLLGNKGVAKWPKMWGRQTSASLQSVENNTLLPLLWRELSLTQHGQVLLLERPEASDATRAFCLQGGCPDTSLSIDPWHAGTPPPAPYTAVETGRSHSRPGFSASAPLTLWTGKLFFVGGCPMHYRTLNNIPGIYPPDASSMLPVTTIKNVSRYCQMFPGE